MLLLVWAACSYAIMLLGLIVENRIVYSIGLGLVLAAVACAVFRAATGRRGIGGHWSRRP